MVRLTALGADPGALRRTLALVPSGVAAARRSCRRLSRTGIAA